MIRIALAEDNPLLAKSVEEKIRLFPGELTFKFHAPDGVRMMEKLESDSNIDVILMDIQMPNRDGIETTALISQLYPKIRIIMLTVFDDEEHIFKAIQAGANGYLLKDESPKKLLEGIKDILSGGAPMSAVIALKAIRLLRNPLQPEEKNAEAKACSLSARELDVLTYLGKGFDYRQISEQLHISPSTVRKHMENIYQKLQVHNKVEAVRKAQKFRFID